MWEMRLDKNKLSERNYWDNEKIKLKNLIGNYICLSYPNFCENNIKNS